MESKLYIRDGSLADLPVILEMNQKEVVWTSDLNLTTLTELVGLSVQFKIILCQEKTAGFVLVMKSTSSYSNANFLWFNLLTSDFWYIDRIVIAKEYSGQGFGRKLYDAIFDSARTENIRRVACEYCTVPLNAGSAAFHESIGFNEVGTRADSVSKKELSMQMYEL